MLEYIIVYWGHIGIMEKNMETIGIRVQAKQRLSWRAAFHALLAVSEKLPIRNRIMRSQTGVLLAGFRIVSRSAHMSYSLNS